MKKDYEIAQENSMVEIDIIAKKAKIAPEYLEKYGKYKAKVSLDIMNKIEGNPDGKLILVTAINPTRAGEGKTTTTVGLVDGLATLNKDVIGALREPSLGPVFGMKGGATGGGFAQVVPMDEINLHFTGDLHAITVANDLISAMIDNHLYWGNELGIDPEKIVWHRALDMNDRALRHIKVAQGKNNGVERADGFDITVASEIMAVFCLAKDVNDLKLRIARMVVAYTSDDQPVTVDDLGITGSVCALLLNAIKPNLVQTLEKSPVLIHGGPFANIAHGCNSIIATKMALKLADYVVTEAGFGADLGAEKFLDIACQVGAMKPSAVVLVATIRALKLHGGVAYEALTTEDCDALLAGVSNLEKHIETIKTYNVPLIIALNVFQSDTTQEIKTLLDWAKGNGVTLELCEGFSKGGQGCTDLAQAVINACVGEPTFKPVLAADLDILDKIRQIAKTVYGAGTVEFSERALQQYDIIKQNGFDKLNVCIAKTQYSLSDDAKKLGRPTDFTLHVTNLKVSAGAGFVVALTGSVMTMPGLPKHPAALDIDVDRNGNIIGMF